MRADEKLQEAMGTLEDGGFAKSVMPDLGESIFKGFKSRSKKIGLWFALKHVIDDDYDAIPEQHQYDLLKHMKKYIEYIEGKA